MPTQRLVRRRQHRGRGLELIPQCLGIDRQPLPPHHARLTLQREVVQVLADGDLDRELRRVALAAPVGPRRQPLRPRRRLHAAVARAPVLLPHVVEDHKPPLDDGDLLTLLGLAGHLVQEAAAGLARALRRRQLVHDVDDGQGRLGLGAVPAPRRGRRRGGHRRRRLRALLRGRAEEGLFPLGQNLFEGVELPLDGAAILAPELTELAGQRLQLGV